MQIFTIFEVILADPGSYFNYYRSGYWSGNRGGPPFPWLLVLQLVTCEHVTLGAKVTVPVVSTTTRLTVEHSIDPVTVGRTMRPVSRSQTAFAAVWLRPNLE